MANETFDRILHTEHMITVLKDMIRTSARGHRGAVYQLKGKQGEHATQLGALTDEQLIAFAAYRRANR